MKGVAAMTPEEIKRIEEANVIHEWAVTVLDLYDRGIAGTLSREFIADVKELVRKFSLEWIHTQERAPGPQDADNAGRVRAINAWMDEEEDGQVNNTLVTVRWDVVKKHPDRYVRWHALLGMPDEPVLPGVDNA